MQDFDRNFESTRLSMLAKQYPEIVKMRGKVVFNAEDNEDRLSGTRWKLGDDTFDQISESGFKIHLIEIIDLFISYRGQCNETPNKEGIVRFGDGSIDIEWWEYGAMRL